MRVPSVLFTSMTALLLLVDGEGTRLYHQLRQNAALLDGADAPDAGYVKGKKSQRLLTENIGGEDQELNEERGANVEEIVRSYEQLIPSDSDVREYWNNMREYVYKWNSMSKRRGPI